MSRLDGKAGATHETLDKTKQAIDTSQMLSGIGEPLDITCTASPADSDVSPEGR